MTIVEDDVKDRLKSLNYEFDDANDIVFLRFAITETERYICNFCNLQNIPDELECVAVDMVCANFLKCKLASGTLQIEGLDFSGVVTSLSEGDISVTTDGASTPEAVFTAYIDSMLNKDAELVTFRKLRW
jgi:hypothetical protein